MDAAPKLRTSNSARMRGLFAGAVVALALSAAKDFGAGIIGAPALPLSFLSTYLVVGLVVSVLVCGGLGNLAWRLAEAYGLRSLTQAAWVGAATGLAIVFVELAVRAPVSYSAAAPDLADVWVSLAPGFLWTIVTGASTGLAARAAAGPPSELSA